ncbi:glycosyltransferase family A protein [Flavobacterium algicola]|uniref:glycosyltransferase family A protein n=1 Tax=Flavobacterium algicola TaxID=556529 RepID=UPI001EFC44A4|nr:glycosyltransferase family 2 protein [Flavobacterium algicola]MCG9793907.1 glycosyltransferase family 2 protein [Flavobacterium algicola]
MEKVNPLVSIIIPNYNHEKFLVQRLDSVFNQTYQNFEVILLDDCSSDHSKEILLKYSCNTKVTHCLFNKVNSGSTFMQWQKGIELSSGEFVWIAESDDTADPVFLETLVFKFISNPKVSLVYCQSNKMDHAGNVMGSWLEHTKPIDPQNIFSEDFIMDGNSFIEKFLIFINVIPNASAVLFRKSDTQLLTLLYTDPLFKYCGDWMFYFQLIVNKQICFISQSLNNFRYHENSVIALAKGSEERVNLLDINTKVRSKIIQFLIENRVTNLKRIVTVNKYIIRNHTLYEKAFLLIKTSKYLKGYFLLLTLSDVFYRNYNFKKNIKLKLNKLFS